MSIVAESRTKETQNTTQGPWTIPAGWRWSTMGEVAEIVGGGTPKSDQREYFGGDISWITPADLSGYTEKFITAGARSITQAGLDNSGARAMPAGTVLFSSRAPIGYVAIAAGPVSTNQGFKSFVLREGLTSDFVYYYLQHAKKLAVALASGTTFLEISGKKAAQIPIPVPPLPSQRRIVAEIEKQFTRLDAGVAALRRVQANLKRYRAAVLKAACEGALFSANAASRLSSEAYGPPATLPSGWRWTTPTEICEQVVDCHNKTAPYVDEGIPLVRTTNIRNGKINMSETKFVDQPTYEFWSRRCRPEPGDILFTREAPMGEAGIISHGVTLCMGQRMMLLRASPKIVNRYLLIAVLNPHLMAHITRAAVGSGVKHLRVRDVESLPIPLPPLAEQKRIVAEVERRLSVIDELETLATANLVRATRLRQSILQQAFTARC